MRIIRAFIVFIGIIALQLGLGLILLSAVFRFTVGDQSYLLQTLADAGVYAGAESAVTDQLKTEISDRADGAIDQRELQAIVDDTFSASLLQSEVEPVIGGVYEWLASDEPNATPVFVLDVSQARDQFLENIADYAVERAERLPVCASPPATSDPLRITCRPPGVDPAAERDRYIAVLAEDEQFLPDTRISSEELFKDADTESLGNLPRVYQALRRGVWIGLGLILLGAVAILSLSGSPRHGARTIARQLLLFGGTWIIGSLLVWLLLNNAAPNIGADQLEVALLDALIKIGQRAMWVLAGISSLAIAAGGGTLLALRNTTKTL